MHENTMTQLCQRRTGTAPSRHDKEISDHDLLDDARQTVNRYHDDEANDYSLTLCFGGTWLSLLRSLRQYQNSPFLPTLVRVHDSSFDLTAYSRKRWIYGDSSSSSSIESSDEALTGEKSLCCEFLPHEQETRTQTQTDDSTKDGQDHHRQMTQWQERWNAISMIPPSLYCLYFVFTTSMWIPSSSNDTWKDATSIDDLGNPNLMTLLNGILSLLSVTDSRACFSSSTINIFPPLPILAVCLGTWLHLPFSFAYHWTYAYKLRQHSEPHCHAKHWSKRYDQASIHLAAALFAYASSGNGWYFAVAAAYNLYYMARHGQWDRITGLRGEPWPQMSSHDIRLVIAVAVVLYSFPISWLDPARFMVFWCVVGTAFWFFCLYPIGGWSHVAFHLAIGLVAPLLLDVATSLAVSQAQLQVAVKCI